MAIWMSGMTMYKLNDIPAHDNELHGAFTVT
jgi:hypothetical protein